MAFYYQNDVFSISSLLSKGRSCPLCVRSRRSWSGGPAAQAATCNKRGCKGQKEVSAFTTASMIRFSVVLYGISNDIFLLCSMQIEDGIYDGHL